ncbi:MAG: hypothetical protein R3F17_11320 [Planctomycetota bacterium]
MTGAPLEALVNARTLELFALDPAWPTEESRADPNTFHGYGVRGHAPLADPAQVADLLRAFAKGARENDEMAAACFDPRHGIRAEWNGATYDWIICFECMTYQIWSGADHLDNQLLSESPRGTFDRIYQGLGLTIAPR